MRAGFVAPGYEVLRLTALFRQNSSLAPFSSSLAPLSS